MSQCTLPGSIGKALTIGHWPSWRLNATTSLSEQSPRLPSDLCSIGGAQRADHHCSDSASIVPTVPAEEQCQLFALALNAAERQDSLINLLIEVQAGGTVDVCNW